MHRTDADVHQVKVELFVLEYVRSHQLKEVAVTEIPDHHPVLKRRSVAVGKQQIDDVEMPAVEREIQAVVALVASVFQQVFHYRVATVACRILARRFPVEFAGQFVVGENHLEQLDVGDMRAAVAERRRQTGVDLYEQPELHDREERPLVVMPRRCNTDILAAGDDQLVETLEHAEIDAAARQLFILILEQRRYRRLTDRRRLVTIAIILKRETEQLHRAILAKLY
ncbi:hypothetical protein PPL_01774 [Heterostelium album PN500]|uniref:Uncharacterized protein n=1 Tax=Heterostelium pallidum (strain ATCC 26659 / Pp 5 / PN500) TaxID=670386 RepID=D3B0F8_HETP5|nr:hypothetical protein PPL_01774 [Heterostelium album PN500]EFA84782.1 hypothetical protein PPL_01774 [Heterostelium album PN500]|eukprot:XP_020436894.1 hypothetical protein PPL_01774 [Heterostelium album PN500]